MWDLRESAGVTSSTPVSYTHLDVYKRQALLYLLGLKQIIFGFILVEEKYDDHDDDDDDDDDDDVLSSTELSQIFLPYSYLYAVFQSSLYLGLLVSHNFPCPSTPHEAIIFLATLLYSNNNV